MGGSVTWFMTGGTTVFTSSASQPPRGAPPPPAPPPPPPEPLAVRRPPRSRLPAQPFLPDTGTFKACLLAMRPMSAACHHPRHQGQPHTHIDCGATRHYRDLLPPQITGRSSALRARASGYRRRSFIRRDLSLLPRRSPNSSETTNTKPYLCNRESFGASRDGSPCFLTCSRGVDYSLLPRQGHRIAKSAWRCRIVLEPMTTRRKQMENGARAALALLTLISHLFPSN